MTQKYLKLVCQAWFVSFSKAFDSLKMSVMKIFLLMWVLPAPVFCLALILEDALVFVSFLCFTYKYFNSDEAAQNRGRFFEGLFEKSLNIVCVFTKKSESIGLVPMRK